MEREIFQSLLVGLITVSVSLLLLLLVVAYRMWREAKKIMKARDEATAALQKESSGGPTHPD